MCIISYKKVIIIIFIIFSIIRLNAQSTIFQLNTLKKIATGLNFTEGPVWSSEDTCLFFSDISGNTIYKWNSLNGAIPYLTPSGNSNGITIKNSHLIIAQHGSRQIARVENNGSITALAGYYNGHRLNSPNDLAVKTDGKIYFTDPPYGITPAQEELGFNGIYYYDEVSDTLILLTDTMKMPNGLAFSPDESVLYVNDTKRKITNAYTLNPDGTFQSVSVFAKPNAEVDGIKVDAEGNVYVAAAFNGIKVYNSNGILIDSLSIPEKMTNLNWGGNDGNTLFITSGTSVYSVICNPVNSVPSKASIEQYGIKVFPNPFADNLSVSIENKTAGMISFSISDCMGRKIWENEPSFYNTGNYNLHILPHILNDKTIDSGIYILKFNTLNYSIEKKILKI